MNSRKLVGFFFKTLFIGGLAGLITSFFVKAEDYSNILSPIDFMELLGLVVFFIGLGLVFAVVSQTGFFAYLFINRFGLGFFKSYWPLVQVLLIAFVLFDLIYFPYQATKGEVSIFWYILMSAAILVYGWIIAKIKAKETQKHAFVPALFLMVVITTIEWVPGLRTEGTDYAWLMIITLLACNTYQLLALHRINKSGKEQETSNSAKNKPAKNAGTKKK
ncbi:KinB-signaling pathway activation protein [Virgibacillus profundi]|uniref:KinB-signaling pathway activation protein n=1 Tax=Virgibacillus profundi TaxID=2024555 RepID=A0A2A2I8E8_9BACI|nr:KinB-signaling pathway activation protein [Virgibacillus profundi]PAV27852.1 KinB-signaling pathway activation protein [Virgibacillus profundi]PXY52030.1 KinB-signaling pathway activation protein [Virgibacillus profundi]